MGDFISSDLMDMESSELSLDIDLTLTTICNKMSLIPVEESSNDKEV